MTFIVKQTEIDSLIVIAPPYMREMLENFSTAVAQHAKDLNDHAFHMTQVEAQKNLAREEQSYQSYPAPAAPVLIDRAVRRRDDGVFVGDFQLINDRPSIEQIAVKRLREKKSELTSKITEIETAVSAKVIPVRKRRSLEFKLGDILPKKEEDRSQDEKDFLKEYSTKKALLFAIAKHGAELHSQIEDLTDKDVDTWTPAPFPEVN